MWSLLVAARHEGIEACLLLEDIRGDWFGRFLFQREMYPLVSAVLLRWPGLIRSI
jgi:hypothetical protein